MNELAVCESLSESATPWPLTHTVRAGQGLPQSLLYSKEDCLSVLQGEPFNNAHLTFFSSFPISFRSTASTLSLVLSLLLLLKAFAIQVHESALHRIRHDNDFHHFRFTFWLQPPCCRIYTDPILHQIQEKEEPSSSSSQKLFRPGTLIPLSAFFHQIFFFLFRRKEARKLFFADLFFALCPPKISAVLHFFLLFPLLPFPRLFFSLYLNPAPFDWCFQGSRILSLAVYLVGTDVPTFTVFYQGPWVLTLAISFKGPWVLTLAVSF